MIEQDNNNDSKDYHHIDFGSYHFKRNNDVDIFDNRNEVLNYLS